MKFWKRISGFTLIEIIVVISIIILVSSSGIVYFSGFSDRQQLKTELYTLQTIFDEYDTKVKKYEIFDYSLSLSTASGSNKSIIIQENIFDTDYTATLEFNDNSGSGSLEIFPNTSTWVWNLSGYKWHKRIIEQNLSWDSIFNGTYYNDTNYSFYSQLWESTLNSNIIYYFSELNIDSNVESWIELTWIYTTPDKSDTWIESLAITNISWEKSNSIWSETIYLFFESSGVENQLQITTN